MHGQAAAGEIVATSKFKPSKASSTAAKQRQQEADVVDDWDAESNDDDSKAGTQSADVFKKSNDQWTEANSQAPAAVPVVASVHGRSLPGAAYGHRLQVNVSSQAREAPASVLARNGGVAIATAPPRILQRPKEAAPGMRSDGSSASALRTGPQEHKTVEQRQEEYRLARERIFGASAKPSCAKNGSPRG